MSDHANDNGKIFRREASNNVEGVSTVRDSFSKTLISPTQTTNKNQVTSAS
jgi:hypothetical protein